MNEKWTFVLPNKKRVKREVSDLSLTMGSFIGINRGGEREIHSVDELDSKKRVCHLSSFQHPYERAQSSTERTFSETAAYIIEIKERRKKNGKRNRSFYRNRPL